MNKWDRLDTRDWSKNWECPQPWVIEVSTADGVCSDNKYIYDYRDALDILRDYITSCKVEVRDLTAQMERIKHAKTIVP